MNPRCIAHCVLALGCTWLLAACQRTVSQESNRLSAPERLSAATGSVPRVAARSPSVAAQQPAAPLASYADLVALLKPKAADSVLLLGVSRNSIEGYNPMFSAEGKPRAELHPGYQTLVLRVHEGAVELAGELPFLAIPQARGFAFVGEASVSIHEASKANAVAAAAGPTPDDAEPQPPHDYDATEFWMTMNQTDTEVVARRLEERLRAARAWGVEHTTQIVYSTPRALCTSITETQWIGGALWFSGETRLELTTLQGRAERVPLSKYAGNDLLLKFATDAVKDRGSPGDPPVNLDEPFDAGWGRWVDWRKDPRVCLARRHGQVWLLGTLQLPGNSSRSYTFDEPTLPAPASLVGTNDLPVEFPAVQRHWPKANDVFFSPTRDAIFILSETALMPFNAVEAKPLPSLPFAGKRVVMAEWAMGANAERWLKELTSRHPT